MKRLLGAILLLTVLNGCAGLPLVSTLEGSLSINGAIGAATGKYETQAVNALVNLASHKSTGKTVSQHLYAAVENKYTKKRLEKHFKNKELSVTNFEIANKSLKNTWHGINSSVSTANYTLLDKYAPNFRVKLRHPEKTFNTPIPTVQINQHQASIKRSYYMVVQ
jgi:hypothetical protein